MRYSCGLARTQVGVRGKRSCSHICQLDIGGDLDVICQRRGGSNGRNIEKVLLLEMVWVGDVGGDVGGDDVGGDVGGDDLVGDVGGDDVVGEGVDGDDLVGDDVIGDGVGADNMVGDDLVGDDVADYLIGDDVAGTMCGHVVVNDVVVKDVYVYVCVYMFVYRCVSVCLCARSHVYECTYACMCAFVCQCVSIYLLILTHSQNLTLAFYQIRKSNEKITVISYSR